jgi:hypothetical protein
MCHTCMDTVWKDWVLRKNLRVPEPEEQRHTQEASCMALFPPRISVQSQRESTARLRTSTLSVMLRPVLPVVVPKPTQARTPAGQKCGRQLWFWALSCRGLTSTASAVTWKAAMLTTIPPTLCCHLKGLGPFQVIPSPPFSFRDLELH